MPEPRAASSLPQPEDAITRERGLRVSEMVFWILQTHASRAPSPAGRLCAHGMPASMRNFNNPWGVARRAQRRARASGRNQLDGIIDALQWPAMAVTLTAAWLVASQSRRKRTAGFWCFVASNALWIAWGLHASAYALIALQVGLFVLNLRGVRKNEPHTDADAQPAQRN